MDAVTPKSQKSAEEHSHVVRKAHQRGDKPALAAEQQLLDLAAGTANLLPLHIGRAASALASCMRRRQKRLL
jgi:hypothetical protein